MGEQAKSKRTQTNAEAKAHRQTTWGVKLKTYPKIISRMA
jgi:hypothetical protein